MGKKSKGLYLALRHIYGGKWIEPALELCRQVFWSAVLPVILTMTTLLCVLQLYLWVRLRWFSSARELHHEALCAYQQQTRKSIRKVRNLLRRAIRRDPTYQPAYLSLAASYLYPPDYPATQRNPEEALKVLDQCRLNTKGAGDITRALILDCQAIQSGQEHMILDALRQNDYLNRAFAKNPKLKTTSLECDDDTTHTNESKECKKDK